MDAIVLHGLPYAELFARGRVCVVQRCVRVQPVQHDIAWGEREAIILTERDWAAAGAGPVRRLYFMLHYDDRKLVSWLMREYHQASHGVSPSS